MCVVCVLTKERVWGVCVNERKSVSCGDVIMMMVYGFG
jgi:hypothetical protein